MEAQERQEYLKIAKSRGFWHNQKPNDFATLSDTFRFSIRIAKYFKTNINKKDLWDGRDENANATRAQVKKMFELAAWRYFPCDIWDPCTYVTRIELTILSARI